MKLPEKPLNQKQKPLFRKRLLSWYRKRKKDLPWRKDFARLKTPYPVLISEIMLQQTQIATVLPKYEALIKKLPTIEHLASIDEETFQELVQGLGYYRRFRFLKKAASQISEAKVWPKTYQEWLELPGIGPYSASAISSIAQKNPVGVVDGNIERVLSRLLNYQGPIERKIKARYQELMNDVVCSKEPGDFNQAMMEVGQDLCLPKSTQCNICPIQTFCLAHKNQTQSICPKPKIKSKPIDVFIDFQVYKNNGKIALIKRNLSKKFFPGTLGLPYLEITEAAANKKSISHLHRITKHKIHCIITHKKNSPNNSTVQWLELEIAKKKVVGSFDRKVIDKLISG